MKANKKTLTLLGIAAGITLALIGAYIFLFYAIKGNTESTASLSERIDELSGRESRIAASVLTLRQQSANIEKLSAYFFKENEIVAFAKKIEALGPQSKTTLTLDTLDLGYTEKTVPYLSLHIKAIGAFADTMRLLVLLENFPGKLELRNVRLVRTAELTTQTEAGVKASKPAQAAALWQVDVSFVALNFTNQ